MAIHKIIEVLAHSPEGWEQAAQNAVDEVGKTVKNVRSVYIKYLEAHVTNGKVTDYRINAKVTFEVDR
jgi:flavin-binding protein dodecin